MPTYHSSFHINQLTQERYGTDVPTLWNEIERLDRMLQHRTDELMRRQREHHELRRRYEKLKSNYRTVFDAYDRAVEALKDEKRRWRRVVY